MSDTPKLTERDREKLRAELKQTNRDIAILEQAGAYVPRWTRDEARKMKRRLAAK